MNHYRHAGNAVMKSCTSSEYYRQPTIHHRQTHETRLPADRSFNSPPEPPKLNLDGILGRKIRVRAGEPIDIRIPMSGAPQPTVEWTRDGRKVSQGGRAEVRASEG